VERMHVLRWLPGQKGADFPVDVNRPTWQRLGAQLARVASQDQ